MNNIVTVDEQSIRNLIETWLRASKAHDNATVLGLMAEDAVFLQPGQQPMRGRAAFAKAQETLANIQIDAISDIKEIKVFGDWAYCWNHLTVTITPNNGESTTRAGHVLTVLHKQDDRWVIVRDANMLSAATP